MRFNLSTAILSLAIASLVITAPAPDTNAPEVEKQSRLGYKIAEWFQEVKNSFNCLACVAGLVTVKNIAWLKRSWALGGVVKPYPLIKMDVDVCSNFIYTEDAVLVDSLLSADKMGGDGRFICLHVGGLCALPAITSGTLTFLKPRPVYAIIPAPSGTLADVLHLSDAALSWGDYNCNASYKLVTSMLNYVPSVANISFGIMTGDIPPHDAWLGTPEKIIPQLKAAFDAKIVVKAKTYPAVGNYAASPLNSMFPTPKSGGDIVWLYSTLADDWTRWLTNDTVKSFENYGSYTLNPASGLRIVSLNTNFCYTINFNCTALYRQVVARYSPHVIAEQFFGHSHYDELSLTYGPGAKSAQNAVLTAWIGPSVTSYTDLNPAFRVYKVDTKSWNVFESLTYVADLDKSASWDLIGSTPNWHLEYSARLTYSQWVPLAADQPLSAAWWHNITNFLESSPEVFKQYWSLRDHNANRLPEGTQANGCVPDNVYDLRASMRSEICSSVHDDEHSYKASSAGADMSLNPAASIITGIRSLGEWGSNAKPWNKRLC
ncbi:hypothetical protein BG015_003153 [Linnemannia schmuckeri]|uniref:Sphingomyelin phosphodiesterase n=1 Tax=Linnemannia schmuckeri TaxID=64567 RepID=A0A9P5V612_9FUNG|nr:hypothetical protein BG015_003153 [Linnemannia schmuckeri]